MSSFVDGLLRVIALAVEVVVSGAGNAPLPLLLGVAGLAGLTVVAGVATFALAVRALAAVVRAGDPAAVDDRDRSVELPVVVVQSDPDAAGHVRSRAPGRPLRPSPLASRLAV